MNYLVCLKQVPNTKNIETDTKTGSLKRETCGSKLNENDEFALSALIEIEKLKKGKKTALTLGPKSSKACLRRALSFGVDEAYHILGSEFIGSDVYATSYAISQAIKKIGNFDLIITGQQTSDGDTGQVPSELASMLNYNFCSFVSLIKKIDDHFIVVTQDDGYKIRDIKIKLPCLISVKENAFQKKESTFKEKILAQKKEIKTLNIEDFEDKNKNNYGYLGSKTKVKKMFLPKSNKIPKIIENPNLKKDIEKLLQEANNESKDYKQNLNNKFQDKINCLITIEDNDILTLYEIITKLQTLFINLSIDVLGINISKETLDDILSKSVINCIYNFKSKDSSYISYIEAFKKLNLEEYNCVFSPSTVKGRSYLPYIAAKMKSGITADCLDFEIDNEGNIIQIRPAFSDRLYAKIQKLKSSKIIFSTFRKNVFQNNIKKSHIKTKINNIALIENDNYEITDIDFSQKEQNIFSEVVFIVGNCISKEDLQIIENEAKKYNANIYCTRPLVIGNLFDRKKQVGISGISLKSKVAVLIGVSGSLQTLAGLKNVNKILFINTDQNANICKNADIGYIKDWKKIIGE